MNGENNMLNELLLDSIDDSYNKKIIEELKKDNLPIVVYGGGGMQ